MNSKLPDYPDCNGAPLFDKTGSCVEVNISTGLVKVDGITVFRIVTSGSDGIKLQFADNDKMRSRARGTRFIEIPAVVLFSKLNSLT
jgi:hypothetical protein